MSGPLERVLNSGPDSIIHKFWLAWLIVFYWQKPHSRTRSVITEPGLYPNRNIYKYNKSLIFPKESSDRPVRFCVAYIDKLKMSESSPVDLPAVDEPDEDDVYADLIETVKLFKYLTRKQNNSG